LSLEVARVAAEYTNGGRKGIRTPGTVAGPTVFKTVGAGFERFGPVG
jgi:hypothetical protein